MSGAKRIKENKERFIGKPLKELLKEIRPQIKWVDASSEGSREFFIFNFVDKKQLNSYRSQDKTPVTIVVYVKEHIEWEYQKDRLWTAEDAEKYGNLTMLGFRVYGDADIEK